MNKRPSEPLRDVRMTVKAGSFAGEMNYSIVYTGISGHEYTEVLTCANKAGERVRELNRELVNE